MGFRICLWGIVCFRADFELLFSDVSSRLFDRFPDDAVVWPGHGAPTTLGAERGSLGLWWERKW